MNHLVDGDDGSHPSSSKYNEPIEKPVGPNHRKELERILSEQDDDETHLDDFTNESLMEELERRFRRCGYLSILDCDKIKFLFENLDKIQVEELEWLTTNKIPLT